MNRLAREKHSTQGSSTDKLKCPIVHFNLTEDVQVITLLKASRSLSLSLLVGQRVNVKLNFHLRFM